MHIMLLSPVGFGKKTASWQHPEEGRGFLVCLGALPALGSQECWDPSVYASRVTVDSEMPEQLPVAQAAVPSWPSILLRMWGCFQEV